MPAFDIADGTVKGPPFHTDVVRIETTLACCLASIQRLERRWDEAADPSLNVVA
jgi:hypothetical protein